MTYPDDRTFQSCLPEYCTSGASPPVSVWEERNYTWTPDKASTPVGPRYVPGSRTHPWSPYEMDDSQVDKQPPPEQVLFALGWDGNASAPGFSASSCRPNLVNHPKHTMSPRDVLQPKSCSESDDSDDTIDRPPPDNPVGPPPKFDAREAKQRNLKSDQKADAARMRIERSCWNCAIVKYRVGGVPLRGMGRPPLTEVFSVTLETNATVVSRCEEYGNATEHTFLT